MVWPVPAIQEATLPKCKSVSGPQARCFMLSLFSVISR